MKRKIHYSREYRKRYILTYLEKNESLSIHRIARHFRVSDITIRRDLDELESEGLVIRTHGGAIKPGNPIKLFDFDKKILLNAEEKLEICRYAASLISENDTIYMDCGSTVYYLARFLNRFSNLRVITNSLPVVADLMVYPYIKVYLIGGELDNSRKALYGQMTENLLERYKADKAFIGAGGVSLNHGLSSVDEKEASITRKMAEAARDVYLLCDSSKIEHDSYFTYSSLSLVTSIITDRKLSGEILDLYKKKKINIVTT